MVTKQLYSNIKKYRKLKKLTRPQFGEKLKVSARTVGRIERGEFDLRFSKIVFISEVLEINLDQLLNLSNDDDIKQ
jgi:transcriptional regulator with XRE-family HTH domain